MEFGFFGHGERKEKRKEMNPLNLNRPLAREEVI